MSKGFSPPDPPGFDFSAELKRRQFEQLKAEADAQRAKDIQAQVEFDIKCRQKEEMESKAELAKFQRMSYEMKRADAELKQRQWEENQAGIQKSSRDR